MSAQPSSASQPQLPLVLPPELASLEPDARAGRAGFDQEWQLVEFAVIRVAALVIGGCLLWAGNEAQFENKLSLRALAILGVAIALICVLKTFGAIVSAAANRRANRIWFVWCSQHGLAAQGTGVWARRLTLGDDWDDCVTVRAASGTFGGLPDFDVLDLMLTDRSPVAAGMLGSVFSFHGLFERPSEFVTNKLLSRKVRITAVLLEIPPESGERYPLVSVHEPVETLRRLRRRREHSIHFASDLFARGLRVRIEFNPALGVLSSYELFTPTLIDWLTRRTPPLCWEQRGRHLLVYRRTRVMTTQDLDVMLRDALVVWQRYVAEQR